MKRQKRGWWAWLGLGLLAVAAMPTTGRAALYHYNDATFKDTPQAQRMYVARYYAEAGKTLKFWTDTASGDATDPVMFLIGDRKDATGQPAIVRAVDDITDVDPSVSVFPSQSEWVTLIVAAYDSAYAGWTTLNGTIDNVPIASPLAVWIGGTAVQMGWSTGDTLTATADYLGVPVAEACTTFIARGADVDTTEWLDKPILANRRCKVTLLNGTVSEYTPQQTCTAAGVSAGRTLVHNLINWRSDRCEYASEVSDTVAVAVRSWSKNDALVVYKDWNDDSGNGRQFRVTFTSTGLVGDSTAVIVGLSPWIVQYKGYYDNPASPLPDEQAYAALADDFCSLWAKSPGGPLQCAGGATTMVLNHQMKPWIRIYKDKGAYTDTDLDGLSDSLEGKLGTVSTRADSDRDGIADALEVYGPIAPARTPGSAVPAVGDANWGRSVGVTLPLPLFGANPLRKDIVVEVDVQESYLSAGTALEQQARRNGREKSVAAAYKALSEADIHAIFLEAGPNRDNVLDDDTEIWEQGWLFPAVLRDGAEPSWLGLNGLVQSFDLQEYPFVRRGAFLDNALCGGVAMHGCGAGKTGREVMSGTVVPGRAANATVPRLHRLPYGRYFVVNYTGWWVDNNGTPLITFDDFARGPELPGTFTHELAHTLGFGHGGPGWVYEYQLAPNRWTLTGYGLSLPLSHAFTTSGGAVEQDVRRRVGGVPQNELYEMTHRQTGTKNRPPSFQDTAFRTIDEASLNEGNGLVTSANGYTFHHILNRRTDVWEDDFRVTWVDWDLSGSKNALPILGRYNTIIPGYKDDFDTSLWEDRVGFNCRKSVSSSLRHNYVTGAEGNSDALGCYDKPTGQYTVADTTNWFPAASVTAMNSSAIGQELEALPRLTYNTELDYLRNLNQQLWATGVDGFWQTVVASDPDWSLSMPFANMSTLSGANVLESSYEE